MSAYVCSRCSTQQREARGCYGNRKQPSTLPPEWQRDECPRRTLLSNPWVSVAASVHRAYGENMGEAAMTYTRAAVQAVEAWGDALAWRRHKEAQASG